MADLAEGGKSRTWNRFVHDLSRPDAAILVFADADIELPEPDTLARLVRGLAARPELHVMNSRPVKDIVHRPDNLSLTDRLIALAGGTLDDWRTAVCGQLYAMPAARARLRHLPVGLPVEDGFLRAMVLTDDLLAPEDFSRIDGEDAWHVYASERSLRALVRHQIRIVIGSAINLAVFDALRDIPAGARPEMWRQAAADGGWLRGVLRRRLPRAPHGYVPLHFLTKRSRRLLGAPRRLLTPRGMVLLVGGFGFDLVVYLLAQARMAGGTGAGYW